MAEKVVIGNAELWHGDCRDVRAAQESRRAALERAVKAEAAWAGEPRHACEWCVDDDGVWYTGCGHAWQFEDGGPNENGTKWCPYCGGRLSEAPNVELSRQAGREGA